MIKALHIAAVVAATLGAREAAPAVVLGAPLTWTHALNDQCTWVRRAWFSALPLGVRPHVRIRLGDLPEEVSDEVLACQMRRGLKSETPLVKTLLPRWPSRAEFTAMETTDEGSFHARR